MAQYIIKLPLQILPSMLCMINHMGLGQSTVSTVEIYSKVVSYIDQLYTAIFDGLYFQVFISLNRSLSLVRQLDNLSEISFVLPSRKKLEKYPLRICFEHYKGLNKYEPAISYVEERFRAHFQRSRDKAQSSKFR